MEATRQIKRHCELCKASSEDVTLAYRGDNLVCQECDSALEQEWVSEDPASRQHYLDTYSPGD